MSFKDVFSHETFIWKVNNNYIGYSQEFLEFLAGPVYDQCTPLNHAPSELVATFERDYHHPKKMTDPNSHLPLERYKDFYNQRYGAGRWESKYGEVSTSTSNASPWDLGTFSY